ncbi:MAG TPA: cellulase family glycosylhydrolase [Aliidongia sp.]|nr:cellulase family glycosylhydrolase [Aliidongia sp.]
MLAAAPTWAALPSGVLEGGAGVNVHFLDGHAADLARIKAMGFHIVRTDLRWSAVETTPGIYDWSHIDKFVGEVREAGLRPMLILDSSNKNYEPEIEVTEHTGETHKVLASPATPEAVAAFAKFAAAAAKRFEDAQPIFEIWNEPDWGAWRPHPDAEAYGKLEAATCHAMREAVPKATIVGPALAQLPSQVPGAGTYIQHMLAAGDFDCLDGLTVHPYRSTDPSTVSADADTLRAMMRRASHNGHLAEAPILYGEWGWSSWAKGPSPERQGELAQAMLLTAIHEHVPIAIWYDWQDDGTDRGNKEHNFGLLDHDGAEKPAAKAVGELFKRLAGAHYEGDAPGAGKDASALLFRGADGHRVVAAWSVTAQSRPLSVKPSGAAALALTPTQAPRFIELEH